MQNAIIEITKRSLYRRWTLYIGGLVYMFDCMILFFQDMMRNLLRGPGYSTNLVPYQNTRCLAVRSQSSSI